MSIWEDPNPEKTVRHPVIERRWQIERFTQQCESDNLIAADAGVRRDSRLGKRKQADGYGRPDQLPQVVNQSN